MTFLLFFLRRIIQLIPALIGITIVAFLLLRVLPGDPASLMIGARGTEADVIALADQLGLDAPLWQQYLTFHRRCTERSFGQSSCSAGRSPWSSPTDYGRPSCWLPMPRCLRSLSPCRWRHCRR